MAEIRIQNVSKHFGKVIANQDINLTIHDREFMVLLGPSGCGKTTLLRGIAGLDAIDSGSIWIGERDVTYLPPRKRRIAMVFQSYAVFPHLTVFENIAFGLRMQKVEENEVKKRVHAAAELLQITNLLNRYPAQVSGGQRQRVAVARALAVQAEVLLMDEPLSNLDALLRLEMRAELKRLLKEVQTTVVYVTHDQVEALSLGDRIAVMRDGKILQCDTPLKVYNDPATVFIGGFIGNPPMNFLSGRVVKDGSRRLIDIHGVIFEPPPAVQRTLIDGNSLEVKMGIRAENIQVSEQARENLLNGEVLVVEPLGSQNLVTVEVGNERIKINVHADVHLNPGQQVWLSIPAEKIRWYEASSGELLSTNN
ncbi:MAG: sugar ABC transporter ATP-binding protein [Bellilinea sp.]|nr:MAG: sugar ABC transporter ATP-binding protein [Bellilinea sp.]